MKLKRKMEIKMKFEIELTDAEIQDLDLVCKFFSLERQSAVDWLLRDQLEHGSNAIPQLLKSLSHSHSHSAMR